MLFRKSIALSDSCIIASVPEGQIASSFGDGFRCSKTNAVCRSRTVASSKDIDIMGGSCWSGGMTLRNSLAVRFLRDVDSILQFDLLCVGASLHPSGSSGHSRPTSRSTFFTFPTYHQLLATERNYTNNFETPSRLSRLERLLTITRRLSSLTLRFPDVLVTAGSTRLQYSMTSEGEECVNMWKDGSAAMLQSCTSLLLIIVLRPPKSPGTPAIVRGTGLPDE
ncbi:hypothetical protein KC364_g32 [Hortaea werneckii]|nr:hypothetical protein KC364_g32 [Hortaea werneckii]